MPALADLQRDVHDTLVHGRRSTLASVLLGGLDPSKRLAIHQRHYRVTLVTALLSRFPATVWLVGSDFVTAAAEEFITTRPPSKPCIAEYGEEFPAFMGNCPAATAVPYLEQFAALEWHVAHVSLAVDHPALTAADLHAIGPDALAEAAPTLQPGLHYLRANWAIDELLSCYLSDQPPDHFVLTPERVSLEVRGARGSLQLQRLAPGEYVFRSALAAGERITDAIMQAGDAEPGFNAQEAVLNLIASGLVTGIGPQSSTPRGAL